MHYGVMLKMEAVYHVKLDGKVIGSTRLETADPPMGVIGGVIDFTIALQPYDFLKEYCDTHGLEINDYDEEFGFIDTQCIDGLKVFREDGVEIEGVAGGAVSGFKDEGYSIAILGVSYPFYGEEFPHHVKEYETRFS